uniref:Serpin domain-containing protein n=1 Tax=Megaselia scalaris TaxID=36166 RepID=T1GSY3_MEGSC
MERFFNSLKKKSNNFMAVTRTNVLIKRHSSGKVAEYLRTNSVWVNGPLATISANLFQTDCSKGSIHERDGEMFFQVHPSIRQRRLVPIPAVVYKSGFTAGYYPELDATVIAFGNIKETVSTIYVMPGQQGTAAPGDNLDRLEKTLIETAISKNSWSHLLNTLVERPGLEVQLPRFSHRSFINASLGLQKMGLKGLFNSDYADLTGLTGSANKDVHLSDVIQINTFRIGKLGKKGTSGSKVEPFPEPSINEITTEMAETTTINEKSEEITTMHSSSVEKDYMEEQTTTNPVVQEIDEYIESNRPDMPDMVDIDPGYLNADFEIPEQTAGEHVTAGSSYMSGMMNFNDNYSKDTLEDSNENTAEIDSLMSSFLNKIDSSNRLSDISSMNESFFTDITTENTLETTTLQQEVDLEKEPKDEINEKYEEEIESTTEHVTDIPEFTTMKSAEELTTFSPESTESADDTVEFLTDSSMEGSTEKIGTTVEPTEHTSYNIEPEEAYLKLGEKFHTQAASSSTSSSSTTTTTDSSRLEASSTTTTEAPTNTTKSVPNSRKPQPYHRPTLEIRKKPVVYSANNLNKPMVRPATL